MHLARDFAGGLLLQAPTGCFKQICNSIKCPSKPRWGVTGRGAEREWECQCRLADRTVEMLTCSSAFRRTPQGPLKGANWFYSGLNGGEEGEPRGPTVHSHISLAWSTLHTALTYYLIITQAITFIYSSSQQLLVQCLWHKEKEKKINRKTILPFNPHVGSDLINLPAFLMKSSSSVSVKWDEIRHLWKQNTNSSQISQWALFFK